MLWRSANAVGTKAEIKLSNTHNPKTVRKRVGLNSISTVKDGFTPPGITNVSNKLNTQLPPIKATK